ncbi:MAG: hypothetical protein H6605_07705 [Flavobacteriales bacterium]|nr:hypothetical protein [Flavobacteriales bacterium]
MRKKLTTGVCLLLILFVSCNSGSREFTPEKDLDSYPKTCFNLTMEHEIDSTKNVVYAATMLYAWKEIKEAMNVKVYVRKKTFDLYLLNKSIRHRRTLMENEVKSSCELKTDISGNRIRAKAEFSKTLPFSKKLDRFKGKLYFDGKPVESFGSMGNNPSHKGVFEIVYYKNDDNFLIRLNSKENPHEIYLYKTSKHFKDFVSVLKDIRLKVAKGEKEKTEEKTRWKYRMETDDELLIPVFNFNISTKYRQLIGNTFKGGATDYIIDDANQRIAFLMDESGAKVESEAEVNATEEMVPQKQSKKMHFNKPFFIMLKRADSFNPYFAMRVQNSELMVK